MKDIFTFAISLFLLIGCAGQRPPEGGPVDATPPEIISVSPSPNTINFTENSIIIEFNEYVDRRSVEDAVFISPDIENIEFDWSGTEVEIIINEQLRKNTTYVITIGTDVVDVQAGNRMAKSFTISFSTGNKIDKGAIAGKVFDEKPEGIMIFSYRLNDIHSDTLNPAKTKPDYLTQTGKSGDFLLTNLAPGTYRLFAIRDEYKNLLYDPETDAAGTTDDVTLTEDDTLKSGIQCIVAKEDTTAPRISSVSASDNRHLSIQFSEPLDSASVKLNSFLISDTLFKNILPIQQFYANNVRYDAYTLVTGKQKGEDLYVVSVNRVKDRSGFIINPTANAKQFTGAVINDTIPPSISFSNVKDSTATIFPDGTIQLGFTDALQQPIPDTVIQLLRRKDSSSVELRISSISPSTITLLPKKDLSIKAQYRLNLKWNGFRDLFGNVWKDSVSRFMFSIDDPENYGSIEGRFYGFGGSSTVVTAENINDKRQPVVKTTTSDSGTFSFRRLPEGRYVLKTFEDINKNLVPDAGTVFPFVRAERFSHYPDTIRVRARWPVEGVLFKGK